MVQKFDPKELELVEIPYRGRTTKTFSYPINKHDHGVATFSRHPWWQMLQAMDATLFTPRVIPDNIARALVFEGGEPFINAPSRFEAERGGH